MESEKVKEIKKALGICKGLCNEDCPYHSLGCMNDLSEDALTLIYVLESKNKRLVESCKNCHYIKDLEIANGHAKELKDRIAELEKENEKLNKLFTYDKSVRDRSFEFIKDIKEKALNQFAEKLKEKAMNLAISNVEVHNFLFAKDIDETLKEFINVDK